jgi:hypothetical protein
MTVMSRRREGGMGCRIVAVFEVKKEIPVDRIWKPTLGGSEHDIADSLELAPVSVMKPAARESPMVMRDLLTP